METRPGFFGAPVRRVPVVQPCQACITKREAARQAYQRRREIEDWTHESRIPLEARVLSLDKREWPDLQVDMANRAAIDHLRAWVASSSSLFVFGRPGTGKTLLAMAAAMDCLRAHQRTLFVSEADLVQEARRYATQRSTLNIVERAQSVDVLVLDDFGALERVSEFVRDIFYLILDKRCPPVGRKRRILITSNLHPIPMEETAPSAENTLAGKYGERVCSRLAGLVGPEYVELGGRDRRRTAWKTGRR